MRSRPRTRSASQRSAGDGEQHVGRGDRELQRRGEGQQRVVRRALEPAPARPTPGSPASRARRHRALRRRNDVFRPQRSQTSEIAGRTDPLIARTARQPGDLHRFGREAPIAPRRRARGHCRSIDSDDRRRGGRRDVQRPGVAADEQPAAPDQRAQLRQVELSEIDDAIGAPARARAAPPPRSAPPPRGPTAPSSARSAAAATPPASAATSA